MEECLVLDKTRSSISEDTAIVENISSSSEQAKILAHLPLSELKGFISTIKRSSSLSPELFFDISEHESAKPTPAAKVIQRFKDDMAYYANTSNSVDLVKLFDFFDDDIFAYFSNASSTENLEFVDQKMTKALVMVKELLTRLNDTRDRDASMVKHTMQLLLNGANWVDIDAIDVQIEGDMDRRHDTNIVKIKYLLSRHSGLNPKVWIEFLFASLLSSTGEDDILRLNPFLSRETLATLLNLACLTMLRTNRLGHINRCIGTVVSLIKLLESVISIPTDQRAAKSSSTVPKLLQMCDDVAKTLTMGRHYMEDVKQGSEDVIGYAFDPRYLVFEFLWNIQLRDKQVQTINDFRASLAKNESKVKQMIMGAGKTSVVAPLLALILADGRSLLLAVCPKVYI